MGAEKTRLEQRLARWLGDPDPRALGTGWVSGTVGVFLATIALGAVLCLRSPEWLTFPRLRELLPLPLARVAIQATLILAFVLAALNVWLRRRKVLGLLALGIATAAAILGGAGIPLPESVAVGPCLGLDWFLLNTLVTALVFVPLERAFPLHRRQEVFRPEWTLDLAWFAASHLGVQVLSLLIVAPATHVAAVLSVPPIAELVTRLPTLVQVPHAMLVADLAQYVVHRASHRVPFLWRFHAIHHTPTALDWLAGSRLHFVDIVLTRGVVLAALLACGFAPATLGAYLVVVALQAVFVHANFAPRVAWLESLVVMPRFHHWHHAANRDAHDKNFAVHFPWLDALFGTHYLPHDAWPEAYGIELENPPRTWLAQVVWPLVRRSPKS